LSAGLNNLPIALSSFIGRERESAAVEQLLHESRLLTVTGPGGSGKTRLALHAAGGLLRRYKDGVWLVELAPLAESALIPQEVASVLGLREEAGSPPLETLARQLERYDVLLILDNCEHLLPGCAELSAVLLRRCRNVRILAASREPLGVPGEVVWAIPPLSLPDQQPWHSPDAEREYLKGLQPSEAIQLFSDRARAALPSFSLTAENGRWVADICRRLDGLPLAIELAAAHARTLSARQIAERLDDRFQLLTSRQRAVPARQQSLEATIDWSYALLPEAEQKVLQRLSVFAGGWTLEAAETIGATDLLTPYDIAAVLASLVDKSLVNADSRENSRRYQLLETIHQYAQRKLLESGQSAAANDRHLTYFLNWAERESPDIHGPDLARTLDQFETEHDNIRAALAWSLQKEDGAVSGLRLATACCSFWNARGHLSEGRDHLSRALDRPEAQERSLARARALLAAVGLAWAQSDFASARALGEEALAISAELGEQGRPSLAAAYSDLGDLYSDLGDYERSLAYLGRALALYRELGDERHAAYVLLLLGWALMRGGDYDGAESYLAESLAVERAQGESQLLGLILAGLGQLAVRRERYREAQAYLQESLALREAAGYQWGIASTLGSLGWLALRRREFGRMRALLQRSIEIRMAIGQQSGVAWCLEKLAEAAAVEAQSFPLSRRAAFYERAARIFGAAAALRAPLNSVMDSADLPFYERVTADLRAAMGDAAFTAAYANGAALSIVEAVELALAPEDMASLSDDEASKARFGGLTARERETALLVAQGKTNREIADAMTVSTRTAETYVTRILNKLGFDSRTQIAVWARNSGLLETYSDQA
jgi:predicted ATPase/DNA-binding CsgD family transcriptional regulator